MKPLLQFDEGFAVQREHIAVVRRGADEKTTVIFTPGQSAVDGGFLIRQDYNDVVNHIHAPENDVVEAAKNLIRVLDEAAPAMQVLAEVAAAHGEPYTGNNFATEIEDLRIALQQAE